MRRRNLTSWIGGAIVGAAPMKGLALALDVIGVLNDLAGLAT